MESQRIGGFKSKFFELKHFDFTEKDIDDAIRDLSNFMEILNDKKLNMQGFDKSRFREEDKDFKFLNRIESAEFRQIIIDGIIYPSLIGLDYQDVYQMISRTDKTLLVEANSIKEMERKIKSVKDAKKAYCALIYVDCASDTSFEEFNHIRISEYIKRGGETVIGARWTGLPEGKRKFYALLCWGKLGAK